MKKIIYALLLTLLLPFCSVAQYNGGSGRGEAENDYYYSCVNPTDGGVIAAAQSICSGSVPAELTNVTLPSGHLGTLEYQWQWSSAATTGFADITDASATSYQPEALTVTTYFRRISRVSCEDDWVNPGISNVIQVTVFPASDGGTVSGGGTVCYGTNSTLLTLSGNTGTVKHWQYSSDGSSWIDLLSQTQTTYTATDLIADTYYRVVVQSGTCAEANSASALISVTKYTISGYAKYYNNPQTPLDGLSITLKQGSTTIGTPYITTSNGFYQFTGLTNDTYNLQVASAQTGGAWATWGGVNNTDYLLVAKHAAGIAYLAVTPPVIRVAANVKTANPLINTEDADAIKKVATLGWGTPPYFNIPKWVFSGTDATSPLDNIVLSCANVSRNIYGLCAGDVNGTFIPASGNKSQGTPVNPSLQLVNMGQLPLSGEMIFPVRAQQDMELGAVTLLLNYDPSKVEITGVEMPENGGEAPYYQTSGGVLNIGWMSLSPIQVPANSTMLMIRTRILDPNGAIRFTLNNNPLSELADGEGNVLAGASLSISDAGFTGQSLKGETLVVYPNPARELLNTEYTIDHISAVALDVLDLAGTTVLNIRHDNQQPGWHKQQLDLNSITPGVYFIRLITDNQTITKKIVVR